jgi:hypothetical protein
MVMAIDLQLHRLGLDIQRKVDDYRKAGKNPYDLFDPSKPDYFGKPEVVASCQPTLHDRFRALGGVLAAQSTAGSDPARNPAQVKIPSL